VRPTGLNSKRTDSPRNATPITTPTKLAWAKIRTAAPIAAASNQSDLIGAFFHRLTPSVSVYVFSVDPRRAETRAGFLPDPVPTGLAAITGALPWVYPVDRLAFQAARRFT
jgi:hypothetical protein